MTKKSVFDVISLETADSGLTEGGVREPTSTRIYDLYLFGIGFTDAPLYTLAQHYGL